MLYLSLFRISIGKFAFKMRLIPSFLPRLGNVRTDGT